MSNVGVDIRNAIHDLLCRFFLAVDERDWISMGETVNGGAIPGQCGGVKPGHASERARHRKGPDRALSC
ncbi:hypothetical protein, partial [Aureimonas glaciei]|uniref:hypothetical protein n=1 Tax=Aureimonas glaciei TaxID=1776957 RepID=UPI001AEF29B4